MSWGDGSSVPTSGNNLIIVGIDNNNLLHIRIFDANGTLVTDTDETMLPVREVRAALIAELKGSLPGWSPPNVLSGLDLRLMSWGDGSGVPTSGNDIVIVGFDNNNLLHIRIFDANGNRVTDTDETKLAAALAEAIATLRQQVQSLSALPVLTDGEKVQVIGEATSIVGKELLSPYDKGTAIGLATQIAGLDSFLQYGTVSNDGYMLALNDGSGYGGLRYEPDTGWWTFQNGAVGEKGIQWPSTGLLHRHHVPLFPGGFYFGSAVNFGSDPKFGPPHMGNEASRSLVRHDIGDGVPTLETWEKGDIVWNRAPAVGEPIGWVCLAAGTNGTMTGITVTANVAKGADRVPLSDTLGAGQPQYIAKWQYVSFEGVDGVYQLVEDPGHPLVNGTVKVNPPLASALNNGAAVFWSKATFGKFGEVSAA